MVSCAKPNSPGSWYLPKKPPVVTEKAGTLVYVSIAGETYTPRRYVDSSCQCSGSPSASMSYDISALVVWFDSLNSTEGPGGLS